jgi:hypothetical protein
VTKPPARAKRKSVSIRSVDTKRLIRIARDQREETGAAWRQQTLGRLLLFITSTYEERILDQYRAAGFPEVRQVHLHVTRHIDIATGSRISDLAARAGVTKGAMDSLNSRPIQATRARKSWNWHLAGTSCLRSRARLAGASKPSSPS